jgi:hypothetical protein
VIDDDLGHSASGSMAHPCFDTLVATVCAGQVGAVLCRDASRLAGNGRDWHHLLALCGLVGARVIDTDGICDPHRPNDRLLLGMKGSISEFELGVIRARMHDARHGKALRGDLRISVPIGYTWHREMGLGLDPNLRVQEAVSVVFALPAARWRPTGAAFAECRADAFPASLGRESARQVRLDSRWAYGAGATGKVVRGLQLRESAQRLGILFARELRDDNDSNENVDGKSGEKHQPLVKT